MTGRPPWGAFGWMARGLGHGVLQATPWQTLLGLLSIALLLVGMPGCKGQKLPPRVEKGGGTVVPDVWHDLEKGRMVGTVGSETNSYVLTFQLRLADSTPGSVVHVGSSHVDQNPFVDVASGGGLRVRLTQGGQAKTVCETPPIAAKETHSVRVEVDDKQFMVMVDHMVICPPTNLSVAIEKQTRSPVYLGSPTSAAAAKGAVKNLVFRPQKSTGVLGDAEPVVRLFPGMSEVTYDAANQYCKDRGSRLAVIDTAEKQALIDGNPFFKRNVYWLGTRCPKADGMCVADGKGCHWFWVQNDGSQIESIAKGAFTNWGEGEGPLAETYEGKDCAYTAEGVWRSAQCDNGDVAKPLCEVFISQLVDLTAGVVFKIDPDIYMSGKVIDVLGKVTMDPDKEGVTTVDDVRSFAFASAKLADGSKDLVMGQRHTVAAWVNWGDEQDSAGRVLFRFDHDDNDASTGDIPVFINANDRTLNFFSDRNGGLRTTAHKHSAYGWQLVVFTGAGNCDTCSEGITNYYIGKDNDGMLYVGSVDRVVSGTKLTHIGHPDKPFGSVSQVYVWDRVLESKELAKLFRLGRDKHGLTCDWSSPFTGVKMLMEGDAFLDTPNPVDRVSGMRLKFADKPVSFDSVWSWDLTGGLAMVLDPQGPVVRVNQHYTMAFWLYWSEDIMPMRTLVGAAGISGGEDYPIAVHPGSTGFGMLSMRDTSNSGWKMPGPRFALEDLDPFAAQTDRWSLYVVRGAAECGMCVGGIQEWFVGCSDKHGLVALGESENTAAGTVISRLGLPNLGPGHVAMAAVWDRALDDSDLRYMWRSTKEPFGYEALTPPPALGDDPEVRRGTVDVGSFQDTFCKDVTLASQFRTGAYHVQVQFSHRGVAPGKRHDPVLAWVEEMATSGFKVCMRNQNSPGGIHPETGKLEWVAYQMALSGGQIGEKRLPRWMKGTRCTTIKFPEEFANVPDLQLTLNHRAFKQENQGLTIEHPATMIWAEEITHGGFQACVANSDGGKHDKSSAIMWLAYEKEPFKGEAVIASFGRHSFGIVNAGQNQCVNVDISGYEKSAPQVLLSVDHSNAMRKDERHEAKTVWIEDLSNKKFTLCVRQNGNGGGLDAATVSWLTVGELFVPPSGSELVVDSANIHFDAKDLIQSMVEKVNNEVQPTPEPKPPPPTMLSGATRFPRWAMGTKCSIISFDVPFNEADNRVYVQASVSYLTPVQDIVHDPMMSWVEQVTSANFTFCASKSFDFDDGNTDGTMHVEWIAYTGTPSGTQAAEETVTDDWRGMHCLVIPFTEEYLIAPMVIATPNHKGSKQLHSPMILWIEQVTTKYFKACFADPEPVLHEDLRIAWISFDSAPKTARQAVRVPVNSLDMTKEEGTCTYQRHSEGTLEGIPTVILTLNFFGIDGLDNPKKPAEQPVVAWIENVDEKGWTFCVRELVRKGGTHEGINVDMLVRLPMVAPGFPESEAPDPELKLRRGFFEVPKWTQGSKCITLDFIPIFQGDLPIHVQVSVSHRSYHRENSYHDPTYAFVKNIRKDTFQVCVQETELGGHDNNAKVEWIAYQDAPKGDVLEVALPAWTGTHCEFLDFDVPYVEPPRVLASINHRSAERRAPAQPVEVWVEECTTSNITVCMFSRGPHDASANLDMLVWSPRSNPFAERVESGTSVVPVSRGTTCIVPSLTIFQIAPAVVFTLNHNGHPIADGTANHEKTTVWAEAITEGGFKICTRTTGYDGTPAKQAKVDWMATLPDVNIPTTELQQDKITMARIMKTMLEDADMLAIVGAKFAGGDG